MELQVFKTLWGHAGNFAAAVAECEGGVFDGIEGQPPMPAAERDEFGKLMANAGLGYIAEICTTGSYVPRREATISSTSNHYADRRNAALECSPLFLTIIAGCDAWSIGQSVEFFGQAMAMVSELGAVGSFETHRSRSFFNPWITRDILRQLPELKLTCDFSHWCVVCERLMDTEPEVIELCADGRITCTRVWVTIKARRFRIRRRRNIGEALEAQSAGGRKFGAARPNAARASAP